MREAGAAALAIAGLPVSNALAYRRVRRPRRQKVAVFGGGIAGLTAAHELAERGFDVTVYERRAWGGKARSFSLPGTDAGGRSELPGEHGLRVEPGFYQHVPDTMRRIPFATNPNGVFDNLVTGGQEALARSGRRALILPLGALDPRPYTPDQVINTIVGLLSQTNLPPQAVTYFALRLTVFLSSCDARRLGQWDDTSWSDFIAAERFTADYRMMLADLFTQFFQASKAGITSTRYAGTLVESVLYNLIGRNSNGPVDRVLNLPTNEAWIEPWTRELERLGVHLRLGETLEALDMHCGRIRQAEVRGSRGRRPVKADWYVVALPVERARKLWHKAVLSAAPELAATSELQTGWMNGLQFYLREKTPLVRGHTFYLDTPWKLISISQAQFWAKDFASSYGDGRASDCLSVVINDWTSPGLGGQPGNGLPPSAVANETWHQLKLGLNSSGLAQLTDDLLLGAHLDTGLRWHAGKYQNHDPLVLPTVGARQHQPTSDTSIPNLALAGDYVAGDWLLANMEAANVSGRQAANTIIERSATNQPPTTVFDYYHPPEWELLKQLDDQRYRDGQPNLFDTTLAPIGQLLNSSAGQLPQALISDVQQLIAKIAPGGYARAP
jgi:uncharacterized protein with NAD-binding domain and iron-sulfur cluster